MERPSFLCVTGGLARGIHPCEAETAHRLRAAIDYLADGEPAPHAARPRELRGFRLAEGGFEEALEEALTLARAPPRRSRIAAPLLLLRCRAAVLQRLAEETGAEAAEEEFGGVRGPSPLQQDRTVPLPYPRLAGRGPRRARARAPAAHPLRGRHRRAH